MPAEGSMPVCSTPHSQSDRIRLGHGSGGKMTSQLIESLFLPRLGNQVLNQLDDAADVDLGGKRVAITTDAYVVSPIFFPGGDIGSLAVHGTLNDLAVKGATPICIAASFILEEGLATEDLSRIVESMSSACLSANIPLVAADTKVVGKGAADKLFITTTGIGLIEHACPPAANQARPGDCIIVSGDIGRHGMAIMSRREGLDLEMDILSDSAPLHRFIAAMLDWQERFADGKNAAAENAGANRPGGTGAIIHCMRDVTRGGLAGVLNELAGASRVGMVVDESLIPVHPQVKAACELLGLDPFYVACEGRFVTIAKGEHVDELLAVMRRQVSGEQSCLIGQVVEEHPGRVVLQSRIGGHRILDKLSGEQLPRIC